MKRFIFMLVLTSVIVAVLVYSMPKGLEHYVEEISADATVSIYCRATDMESVDMGFGKIVKCSVSNLKCALAHCDDVDGFSFSFDGSEQDVERIAKLFNLTVTSTLNIDGLLIVCGNSGKLTGGVILEGDKVNLQIAYKQGSVTVGSPLILGDY